MLAHSAESNSVAPWRPRRETGGMETRIEPANLDDAEPRRRGRITARRVERDVWSVSRVEFGAGARWRVDAGEPIGAEWCEVPHRVVVLSGSLELTFRDGGTRLLRAGDVADIPAGHDASTVGPQACTFLEYEDA